MGEKPSGQRSTSASRITKPAAYLTNPPRMTEAVLLVEASRIDNGGGSRRAFDTSVNAGLVDWGHSTRVCIGLVRDLPHSVRTSHREIVDEIAAKPIRLDEYNYSGVCR
jgi:hypothetical protein